MNVTNVTTLKLVETLEQAAAGINKQFDIADKEHEKGMGSRNKERYARLTAGLRLHDARERVDAGHETNMGWEEWCKHSITRSQRDIRKVMELAAKVREKQATPKEVVEQARAKARDAMRATRASRSNISPVGPARTTCVEAAMNLIRAMTPDELAEFDQAYQAFKEEHRGN